jgi:formate hydrogenlyase subunit 3/multisubunit Na+/H+ antiporter MnhD subunit
MGPLRPDTIILIWLLVLPFFAALCAALFPRLSVGVHSEREAEAMRRGPFLLGALASLMGVGLSVSLFPSAVGSSPVTADYWWTKDLYHLRFQADALSAAVLVALWGLGMLLHLHLAGHPLTSRPHRKAALLLAAQGCLAACCLGADLILICFLLQLALLCLWRLVHGDAPGAASSMLSVTLVGSAGVLGGALLIWVRSGDSSTAPLAMLLTAVEPSALAWMSLLVLLGLLPLIASLPANGWLPRVAEESPSLSLAPALLLPVTGLCLLLRLLPGAMTLALLPGLGAVALLLGAGTLWWGAIRSLLTGSLRHLAAWLTVAQAGPFLIALGAATNANAPPGIMRGAALQALAAPAALAAVWLAASTIRCRFGTDSISELAGLLRSAPLASVGLLIGGLSVAGLPPLPGFHVQRLLISGLLATHSYLPAVALLGADALMAVAVLDTVRRMLPARGGPPLTARWTSPWLSASVALVVLAILVAGVAFAPLAEWSQQALRGALSISGGGLFTPR